MKGYLGSLMRMTGLNFGAESSPGHLEAAAWPQPIHREETRFVQPSPDAARKSSPSSPIGPIGPISPISSVENTPEAAGDIVIEGQANGAEHGIDEGKGNAPDYVDHVNNVNNRNTTGNRLTVREQNIENEIEFEESKSQTSYPSQSSQPLLEQPTERVQPDEGEVIVIEGQARRLEHGIEGVRGDAPDHVDHVHNRDTAGNRLTVREQDIEYEIEFEESKSQTSYPSQSSQPLLERPIERVQLDEVMEDHQSEELVSRQTANESEPTARRAIKSFAGVQPLGEGSLKGQGALLNTPYAVRPAQYSHPLAAKGNNKIDKEKNESETGKITLADVQQWVSAAEPERPQAVNKSPARSTLPREQVSRRQQEVQEFTLSIGSINLTVEEPPTNIQTEPNAPPVNAGRSGVGESSASRLGRHYIRVR